MDELCLSKSGRGVCAPLPWLSALSTLAAVAAPQLGGRWSPSAAESALLSTPARARGASYQQSCSA